MQVAISWQKLIILLLKYQRLKNPFDRQGMNPHIPERNEWTGSSSVHNSSLQAERVENSPTILFLNQDRLWCDVICDVSMSNEDHYKCDKIIKFDPKIRWLMYPENNEDLTGARDNWDRTYSSFCSICDNINLLHNS